MSAITTQDIKKVSRLARIKVADSEIEKVANTLSSIISWIGQLSEVNTDKVEILTNVHNSTLRLNQDNVKEGNIAEEVLKNSQGAIYGYFTVPKVIE